MKKFQDLQKELFTYEDAFRQKQGVIVLNKIDLLDKNAILELTDIFTQSGLTVLPISAVTGDGLSSLIHSLGELLERAKTAHEQVTVG